MTKRSVTAELVRFGRGVWDLVRSWPYMCLVIMATLGSMAMDFVLTNFYLLYVYTAQLKDYFQLVLFLALLSCAVCVPLTRLLLQRFSKRTMMAIGIGWCIANWIALACFPTGNLAAGIVFAVLSGGGLTVRHAPARVLCVCVCV
jgi:Na+/melibiose symporter-like transporter